MRKCIGLPHTRDEPARRCIDLPHGVEARIGSNGALAGRQKALPHRCTALGRSEDSFCSWVLLEGQQVLLQYVVKRGHPDAPRGGCYNSVV
jgi:hypothetical protein